MQTALGMAFLCGAVYNHRECNNHSHTLFLVSGRAVVTIPHGVEQFLAHNNTLINLKQYGSQCSKILHVVAMPVTSVPRIFFTQVTSSRKIKLKDADNIGLTDLSKLLKCTCLKISLAAYNVINSFGD